MKFSHSTPDTRQLSQPGSEKMDIFCWIKVQRGTRHFTGHTFSLLASLSSAGCSLSAPFSRGKCWGYLQPPPPTCSFSETRSLQLRADLLIARGQWQAKVLHSNHKEFQATFKQQRVSQVLSHTRKQFSGSELYLLLSSPPQGYRFFLTH